MNKPYYEKTFAAPHTLVPDALSKKPTAPTFETVTDKKVMSDGSKTLELHLVAGNVHNDGMLLAYLPKEKVLVEADLYTPPNPGAPLPNPMNPKKLLENTDRLKLDYTRIAALHGRLATKAELLKAANQ
jgi:hypothetical protein